MVSLLAYKVIILIILAAGSGSTASVAYYYQGKTSTLTIQVSNLNDQTSSQANQINSLKTQIENLTLQINRLQSTENQLLVQITELQQRLANGSLCSSGKTLKIGELLDLSSALALQGERARDSSTLAIEDVNAMLSTTGCNLRFSTTVDDYSLNNALALTELQSLSSAGVNVIVGPLNSGAAQFILSYADANHIVLISPSSTSAALAIPNDYLFRTIPDDRQQALADARMIVDNGAKGVIIVQRHDIYGDSVANATATRFKELGGQVIADLQYDVSTTNFTPLLDALEADFTNNVAAYGAGHIAIYVVGFEELGQVLLQARAYSGFPWSTLPWFSTDGVALDSAIISGSSGLVAAQVKLPSTNYASLNNTKTLALYTRFDTAYPGEGCDEYCKGAYDDVWLAALTTLQAGSYDGAQIQAVMPTLASNYYGVTGWTELLPSGDRAPATYQIWEVLLQGSPPVPTWVLIGSWDSTTDAITS